jgi:hypothetical protein
LLYFVTRKLSVSLCVFVRRSAAEPQPDQAHSCIKIVVVAIHCAIT